MSADPGLRPSPGEILLVRHAETEWSQNGRHTGRTDIPLTERGRTHARGLATALADVHVGLVLCSPLRRARETCELAGFSGQARMSDELMEWDYGDYEGLTTREILAERPDWSLWRDGAPGGEDPRAIAARADRVIAELARAGEAAAIFSHGHMLRVLGARWIELEPACGSRLGLGTGALCILGRERETRILRLWNRLPD